MPMTLAEELALRCVLVKHAGDNSVLREEFEDEAARERVSRSHAARMKSLVKSRTSEEAEKTPWDTFSGRLYPIPHTSTEALTRLPLIGAGGLLGYQAAANTELPDAAGIRELLQGSPGGKPKEAPKPGALRAHLETRLAAVGHTSPEAASLAVEKALLKSPSHVRAALGVRPDWLVSEETATLRGQLNKSLGKDRLGILKEELRSSALAGGEKGVMGRLATPLKWRRMAGAGAGLMAASLLTGVPLGLRALALRRSGGEAANRARNSMNAELARAEEAKARREEILQQIEA